MAATKRFMNWSGVTFTPTGGSATNFTGVKSIAPDFGGSLVKFSGDGDHYNTTVVTDHAEPGFTIQLADFAAAETNGIGTVGTFVATLNDSKGGVATGSGARTYTLVNAVIESIGSSAEHRAIGMATVKITSYSSDGTTNPLSVAVA